MIRPLVVASFIGVVAALAVACGDDTGSTNTAGSTASSSGSGGAGGADDGKLHPPTNGVAIAEAAACSKVELAFEAKLSALACIATAQSCPGLIQAPSGAESCSSYDEGAAQGCADYVTESADCDELKFRIGDCIVEPVEGSAPGGCPT